MRSSYLIVGILALGLLGGCGVSARPDLAYRTAAKLRAPVLPPPGVLYSDVKAPLAANPTDFGTKRGTATSKQLGLPPLPVAGLYSGLDLVGWGDASAKTAAARGGITRIEHVDYHMKVYFMFYRVFTTEVYGN